MANTPDPRDFYRVTRVLLMPSLWNESLRLVAAEAMLNAIPVLASTRGALPETVGQGGVLLDLPAHLTPQTRTAPTAEEVTPWMKAIFRLWDDEDAFQQISGRAQATAESWRPNRAPPRCDALFRELGAR